MTFKLENSNRDLAGKYKETSLDVAKKASNRLTSICGKYYTIQLLNGETLTLVGKRQFNAWTKLNSYITDF